MPIRIDQALVDRGLVDSREKAKRHILAGQVFLNGHRAAKASDKVKDGDNLEVKTPDRYVSRGGHKLEKALSAFRLDPSGIRAIDLGASTGGFTDCLLQHGASSVCAVDVGQNQLAWKLRDDDRVDVREKTNARHLDASDFPSPYDPFDWAVIDCSFISLRLILPAAERLTRPGGLTVALIKPQFEAGKEEVDKGAGVIRDPEIHDRVISELRDFVSVQTSFNWNGLVESPILGPAGNKEFLVLLDKGL